MAVFKVINNPLDDEEKLSNVCSYIIEGRKDDAVRNSAGRGVTVENAFSDMTEMLDLFDKNKGRLGYHFVVSFAENEPLGDSDYMQIGMDISDFFFPEHQVLFARHKEKDGLEHLHFLVCSASLNNAPKLHLGYVEQAELEKNINEIIDDYKL